MQPGKLAWFLGLMVKLYMAPGFWCRLLSWLVLPFLILLLPPIGLCWLGCWVKLHFEAYRHLRRQAAGLKRWRDHRNDRIHHPEKYRGRE